MNRKEPAPDLHPFTRESLTEATSLHRVKRLGTEDLTRKEVAKWGKTLSIRKSLFEANTSKKTGEGWA